MADRCWSIKVAVLTIWSILPVIAVPTLTIQPTAPNTGSTLTLTCELAGFTNALMTFNIDGTTVYGCAIGGQTCDDSNGLSDYAEVDWSQTNKGIVTISNAAQTRDGGDWTCAVGGGPGTSVAVTLAITDADCGNPTPQTNGQVTLTTTATTTYQSTATYSCDPGYTIDGTATTTCQADGTWSGSLPTCTGTTTTTMTTATTPTPTTTTTTQAPTTTTTTPAPTTTTTTQAPTTTTTTTTTSTTQTTRTSTTSTTTGSTGSTGTRKSSHSQTNALIIALPTVFGSIIVMATAAFGVIWFRKHYNTKNPNSTF